MAGRRYVIALDQGTTSSRAALVDRSGRMVDVVQRPFQQIFPKPGWVEHNPQEILFSQLGCCSELVARHGLGADDVAAIGIDNQRETVVVWDPATGVPVCNAIVWQCRRTAEMVERVCGAPEVRELVRSRTGLLPDAYFSASKIAWALDNVAGARARRGGRAAVWHRGHVARVGPHRRARARHGPHQREPHDALRHPPRVLGR